MAILIAAAGTGGHVFPGLAVGEALVGLGIDRKEVLFVGGSRLEAEVFPAAGFPFAALQVAGLQRRLTLANLRLPRMVMRAARALGEMVEQNHVTAALGLGGYVTVPAALAARRRGIPLLLSEQNAEAGLANRLCARWARRVFTAFPETAGLPEGEWVGNPIRELFADFDRAALRDAAREHFGITDKLVVGVMGGSLGAGVLNEVAALLADTNPAYTILNLAGGSHLADQLALAKGRRGGWIVRGFEERMDLFYAAIDLVIGRAGGVVAEYTATSTPAVLIPGGFGSAGHQVANARALERARAAVVVGENEVERIPALVAEALQRRHELARGAATLARPQAAVDIARALIDIR